MNLVHILLGTKLAKTPGGQLAIDLFGLVLVIAVLLVAGVRNPWAWILLPGGVLVMAVVRTALVARRRS